MPNYNPVYSTRYDDRTGNSFSVSLFINEYLNAINMHAFSSFSIVVHRCRLPTQHTAHFQLRRCIFDSYAETELKTIMRETMTQQLATGVQNPMNAVRQKEPKARFNYSKHICPQLMQCTRECNP